MDERYVVVDVKGKGLVVFSSYVPSTPSCSPLNPDNHQLLPRRHIQRPHLPPSPLPPHPRPHRRPPPRSHCPPARTTDDRLHHPQSPAEAAVGGTAALYRAGSEGLVEGEVGGGLCLGWGWGEGGFWGGGGDGRRRRRVQDCRLDRENTKNSISFCTRVSFLHWIWFLKGKRHCIKKIKSW